MPKGFIPAGTGPKGARYGRDPATGLAYKRDGTPRKKRTTLDTAAQIAKLQEQEASAMRSIGKKTAKAVTSLEGFLAGLSTFNRWRRDCAAYGTPEAVAARKEYFQRQLELCDEKAERAEAWLPGADEAIAATGTFYEDVGRAMAEAVKANDGQPLSAEEAEALVRAHLSDEVRDLVAGAANPENDPFAGLRRGDLTESDEDEDEDELED